MRRRKWTLHAARSLLACAALLVAAGSALAQVGPAEILNPKLKAAEQKYLPQLQSLQHSISEAKFPFPFALARYVGVDPGRQAALDSRGLEFVYFQSRMLLKISGNYSAAYNSDQLTQNERASRTFQEVVVPILRVVTQQVPPDVDCDAIGFEIAYHTRAPSKNYDYEGKEMLVVVFDRADALNYLRVPGDKQRQEILNRSAVYVNGANFGLALGDRDPLDVETLERSVPGQPVAPSVSPAAAASATARLSRTNSGLAPTASGSSARTAPGETAAPASPSSAAPFAAAAPAPVPAAFSPPVPAFEPKPVPAAADAERLQARFQPQLDALVKGSGADFHFVDYAPPSFALYHNQIVLQLTLRNPLPFEKSTTSIYKRAAQSFDLFLAPRLKALVQKLPSDLEFDAFDFSVLNRLGVGKDSSEAVEFICPLKMVRSFVEDEITSQDLVNQSIVLVNGVRIALTLQLVE